MQSQVAEFTRASDAYGEMGQGPMTREQYTFLLKLVVEELLEMGGTVVDVEEARQLVVEAAVTDTKSKTQHLDETGKLAEQMDAFCDLMYVTLNVACRKGWNLKPLFDVVHEANMRKANPATGKFDRNEFGKIVKPPGWTPPDVVSCVPLVLDDEDLRVQP